MRDANNLIREGLVKGRESRASANQYARFVLLPVYAKPAHPPLARADHLTVTHALAAVDTPLGHFDNFLNGHELDELMEALPSTLFDKEEERPVQHAPLRRSLPCFTKDVVQLHQEITSQHQREAPSTDPASSEPPTIQELEHELEEARVNAIRAPDETKWNVQQKASKEEVKGLILSSIPVEALLLPRNSFNKYNTKHKLRELLDRVAPNKVGRDALTDVRKKLMGRERARVNRGRVKVKKQQIRKRWKKARLTIPMLSALKYMASRDSNKE